MTRHCLSCNREVPVEEIYVGRNYWRFRIKKQNICKACYAVWKPLTKRVVKKKTLTKRQALKGRTPLEILLDAGYEMSYAQTIIDQGL